MKTKERRYPNLALGKRYFFDNVKDVSGVLILITETEIRFDKVHGNIGSYITHKDGTIGFGSKESGVFHEIIEE